MDQLLNCKEGIGLSSSFLQEEKVSSKNTQTRIRKLIFFIRYLIEKG